MPAMAASMADHLRAQEYSRIRHSTSSLLMEPPLSDEASAKLLEVYERDECSPREYLEMVTEQRAFTPPPTTHAVVIKTGSYCSNMAVPVILKSFLQDHGNATVKEVLSHHGVAMVEKMPSGGVLVRVRSAEVETKLAGQEVILMGKKFKIEKQSLLLNKFFLDVSGIHSEQEADALFLALCAIGARPLFLTPRDVNLETQVTTPTWRFYFGSADPPQCLMVHSYVTHQLVYGRSFYVVRGKHTTPPPVRANMYRQSRYAVVLPFNCEPLTGSHNDHSAAEMSPSDRDPTTPVVSRDTTRSLTDSSPPEAGSGPATQIHDLQLDNQDEEDDVCSYSNDTDSNDETQWNSQGEANSDMDMSNQMESGFKRTEASFAHENPFSPLDAPDCDFDVVQPETTPGVNAGVIIIPHLNRSGVSSGVNPAPSKKRITSRIEQEDDENLALEEALLLSEKEAQISTRDDRVSLSVQHYQAVDTLLHGSKNMDQIVQSMCSTPLAWTKALLDDLTTGGSQTMELADIHLWNRVLASETMDDDNTRTFHDRITALKLPIGSTRNSYSSYLKQVFERLPSDEKNDWNLLRWLSIFELIALCMYPSIFTQHGWVQKLVESAGDGLPHSHVKLFSDTTLLQLTRSVLGERIMGVIHKVTPGSVIGTGLSALRSSDLSPENLPALTSNMLCPPPEMPAMEAGRTN